MRQTVSVTSATQLGKNLNYTSFASTDDVVIIFSHVDRILSVGGPLPVLPSEKRCTPVAPFCNLHGGFDQNDFTYVTI